VSPPSGRSLESPPANAQSTAKTAATLDKAQRRIRKDHSMTKQSMLTWHPFTLRFPPIEGEEWENFKESIREARGNNVPVIYRILPDGTKQGIDGRNRERACEELFLKCRMEEVILNDDEVIPFILANNLYRRHMKPELRRSIVSELRGGGKGIREIAETIGVSHTTVIRDIEHIEEKAGGTHVPPGTHIPPEEETTTGKDGKKYSRKPRAPKPKKIKSIVLCQHCAHHKAIGRTLIDDCPDCKQLKKGEKQEAKTKKRRDAVADPLTEIYDDEENVVPAALRAIFADSPLYIEAANSLEQTARILDQLEASPGYIIGNKKLHAGESKNVDKHVYSTTCRQGVRTLKATRPAVICSLPCPGEGCKACKGKGYLTANENDEPK